MAEIAARRRGTDALLPVVASARRGRRHAGKRDPGHHPSAIHAGEESPALETEAEPGDYTLIDDALALEATASAWPWTPRADRLHARYRDRTTDRGPAGGRQDHRALARHRHAGAEDDSLPDVVKGAREHRPRALRDVRAGEHDGPGPRVPGVPRDGGQRRDRYRSPERGHGRDPGILGRQPGDADRAPRGGAAGRNVRPGRRRRDASRGGARRISQPGPTSVQPHSSRPRDSSTCEPQRLTMKCSRPHSTGCSWPSGSSSPDPSRPPRARRGASTSDWSYRTTQASKSAKRAGRSRAARPCIAPISPSAPRRVLPNT